MGYTTTVTQYRSFTDNEWNQVVALCKTFTERFSLELYDDHILHVPYESWSIHRSIDREISQFLKPGCGETDIYFLRSLIDLYAPGVFLREGFNTPRDNIENLLSCNDISYVSLKNRVVFSLDNEVLLEYKDGDSPYPLMDKMVSIYINE